MNTQQKLTDRLVRAIPAPATGHKVTYDSEVAGFGIRVTSTGARAFVLNYRTRAGRERRFTIGAATEWGCAAARKYAADLKQQIRTGHDPLGDLESDRAAKTVGDLCDAYIAEFLDRLRPSTRKMYLSTIEGRKGIRTAFKHVPVADLRYADVAEFHRTLSRSTPTGANRSVAVLSRMLGIAVRKEWCPTNVARGIERNQETKRTRYLQPAEIAKLSDALESFPDQQAATVVRVLLLTGARHGETLAARWEDVDREPGMWIKPGSTTKQKTEHRLPLSAAAQSVVAGIPRTSPWLFPSATSASGHRESLASAWPRICEAAGLVGPDGKPTVRIHDLRHTHASVLVSAGLSLPIIGKLLGHTQVATTDRYSHLADDPLREAAERAAAVISGKPSAKVVPIRG